jgi:hypothetical protein
LREAPVQFAVFCDHGTERGHGLGRATMPEMLDYSVVAAITQFWLSARVHGLGVGWVSILDPGAITAALDTPPALEARRLSLRQLAGGGMRRARAGQGWLGARLGARPARSRRRPKETSTARRARIATSQAAAVQDAGNRQPDGRSQDLAEIAALHQQPDAGRNQIAAALTRLRRTTASRRLKRRRPAQGTDLRPM